MMEKKNIYFLGIGGIGMSALARYFLHEGCAVAGYDRTRTPLTDELEAEGASIHYEDDVRLIPEAFLDPARTIVVYTPAVPQEHSEFCYLREHGFTIEKRSQMLGHLSEGKYVMAVAGTHGKTTTSTLVAWLNRALTGGGSAFLGGISKNFGGNLVLGGGRRLAVEADEFDRSFLRLYPDVAVVTSADPDHLDIYGTHEALKEAFAQFIRQIRPDGYLIRRLPDPQTGGRTDGRQPRDHHLPLCLRYAVRLLRPERGADRRRALPFRCRHPVGDLRGLHARHSGVGQHRKCRRCGGLGVVRRAGHGRGGRPRAAA